MQFVYSHKKLFMAGGVAVLSGLLTAMGKMSPAQAVAFSTALAGALGLEDSGKTAEPKAVQVQKGDLQ